MSDPQRTSDSLVTKDGVRVRVGQLWRDCDERMNGRKRYVGAVSIDKAFMVLEPGDSKGTWVSIRRMHKNNRGWELVTP
jgi:hypothetical protein